MRLAPATPAEKREAFQECLADALRGEMPPSGTGLHDTTLQALEAVAIAAYTNQPTPPLIEAASAAFATELAG
jgi:hypothetical protein